MTENHESTAAKFRHVITVQTEKAVVDPHSGETVWEDFGGNTQVEYPNIDYKTLCTLQAAELQLLKTLVGLSGDFIGPEAVAQIHAAVKRASELANKVA